MQTQTHINIPVNHAPRFPQSENVAHVRNFHQSAAMHAARMVRYQYASESKSQFRRECIDHLKASLSTEQKASA